MSRSRKVSGEETAGCIPWNGSGERVLVRASAVWFGPHKEWAAASAAAHFAKLLYFSSFS